MPQKINPGKPCFTLTHVPNTGSAKRKTDLHVMLVQRSSDKEKERRKERKKKERKEGKERRKKERIIGNNE